jgi:hypothetical protein
MKKKLVIGPYVWHGIPGELRVEVTAIDPADLANYKSPDGEAIIPQTINELKQRLGGMQGYLVNPISGEKFLFDLSPWSHLKGETYLDMLWSHKADQPIPLSDPRHPQHRRKRGDLS